MVLFIFSCSSSLLSRGIHPSTNLVDCEDNCYTSLSFFFLLFFYISSFWNLEICCSVLFVLSCVLFCYLSFPYFYSFLLSIPCSVFSLCLFTLFSDLLYCFLFNYFPISYYSILSASPLCSIIIIQSVLFLLFFIILDPSN